MGENGKISVLRQTKPGSGMIPHAHESAVDFQKYFAHLLEWTLEAIKGTSITVRVPLLKRSINQWFSTAGYGPLVGHSM